MKLSSTYYTLPEAVAVPVGEIVEPDTLPQAPQTMIVQYLGHIVRTIIGDSVSYTLHHPEGYITLDALHRVDSWNYFRRDHLGNNVAVWNASADTTIQRMFYYPSGLPIGISTGQGAQPYKYNGKEYDEMHGYDVYDYGFRGYYASIARFTSIDPLCERTPWQSPYCYASNNFTGEIDWMGLYGIGGFMSKEGGYQLVLINRSGIVIYADLTSPNQNVYLVDNDEWDGDEASLIKYRILGSEIQNELYIVGQTCNFRMLNGEVVNSRHFMQIYNHINQIFPNLPSSDIEKLLNEVNFDYMLDPMNGGLLNSIIRFMEKGNVNPEYLRLFKESSLALLIAQSMIWYQVVQQKGMTNELIYEMTITLLATFLPQPWGFMTAVELEGAKVMGEILYKHYTQLDNYLNDNKTWENWYNHGAL